jgi:hypothetical protein
MELSTSASLSKDNASDHYKRLIVVIPNGELDENKLALHVGKLALLHRANILFLGIIGDPEGYYLLRRRLATLAALVGNKYIKASKEIALEPDWLKSIKQYWKEDDLVVCLASHYIRGFPHRKQSLGDIIDTHLHIPVLSITDIPFTPATSRRISPKALLAWCLSIGIIGLFAALQYQVQQQMNRGTATMILCLSVVMELFLIWKANQYL